MPECAAQKYALLMNKDAQAPVREMKAVYFDGSALGYDPEFPDPTDESVVRVSLAGICGTDLQMVSGYMGYKGVLGHEFVGTVAESEVSDMVGRRVVGEINAACGVCGTCASGLERHCPDRTVLGILGRNGAFAEYLSLPTRNLHVLPDSVPDRQAVFVEPLAAAFEIAEQVTIDPRWRIAVLGDGRLGQLVSMVLDMSADVVCFGRHPDKLARLGRLGVRTSRSVEPSDTGSFDMVVDATGRATGLADAARLARPRGIIVLKSTTTSGGNQDLTQTIINEFTLVGSRCGPFAPAIDALASGSISVDGLVDSVYRLDQYKQAFERAGGGALKVLFAP